ncbi:Actin-related protein 2/3 complex subunit 1A [Morella rubra]|uniref:Arp2/3 complex 41 kDa subunit n=1 Tax=Morella rubra TaxID=262757 RepID=A0A6A1VKJ8_9ROSI|nr:Actin-related protein 2/3 complex subunit 1A [Morella rubra]
MAAIAVHRFAQSITCHAWSPDHSMVAFCPNSNEVHIYRLLQDKWEKVHVLQKHDQIVSGIDWSARSNRIVTASHDRNSYVWNFEGTEWVPTLVILRLNRAALCVQWSPKENKFAVGSGAKLYAITSKRITVFTAVKNGFFQGFKNRFFFGFKFGEQIVQLDLSFSWAFGVKWSPSGNTLAYVGHNSMIYFVDDVGPSPLAQSVAFQDLPLCDVLFVSERMVIGVGYDCSPMVFAADERGIWSFIRFLGERKIASSGSTYGSQFSEAFVKLYGQSKHVVSNDAVEPSRSRGGIHENCISCIVPLRQPGISTVPRFSTSGLDGKVVIWDLENQADLSVYL